MRRLSFRTALLALTAASVFAVTCVSVGPAHPASASAVPTADPMMHRADLATNMGLNIRPLDTTLQPPAFGLQQLEQEVATSLQGWPQGRSASSVLYEYAALTAPISAFTPDSLAKDPTLARTGHPVDLPVWIVSFQGMHPTVFGPIGYVANASETGSINGVYDAATGLLLMGFSL